MKSSLRNMVLMLFVIAFVCSAAVAGVFQMTKEPIEKAQAQKVVDALRKVLPEFDETSEKKSVAECGVYEAVLGGEIVGYAVESVSHNGFSGDVKIIVGFTTDGTIYNIEVLEQAETPGLGANMVSEDNVLVGSFVGKRAEEMNMTVRKDGGDVDALTAATISSRAFSEAVAFAYAAYLECAAENGQGGVDASRLLPESDQIEAMELDGVAAYKALLGNEVVGYAVEGRSNSGFNGLVRVMVGFGVDGTIVDVAVLEQNETPGLGTKMCDEGNALVESLKGKSASGVKFALKVEGGDVDALTAATVSSRAYVEAVESAYETFKKINL